MSSYFNHPYALRNTPEILELRACLGYQSYAVYLMVLETIAESNSQSINGKLISGLAISFGCDVEFLKKVLTKATELNLFFIKGDFIFSNHLKEHFEKRAEIKEKRAEAGAKGGKAKANAKQMLANAKQNLPKESKESKNKINKIENKEKIKEILENPVFLLNKQNKFPDLTEEEIDLTLQTALVDKPNLAFSSAITWLTNENNKKTQNKIKDKEKNYKNNSDAVQSQKWNDKEFYDNLHQKEIKVQNTPIRIDEEAIKKDEMRKELDKQEIEKIKIDIETGNFDYSKLSPLLLGIVRKINDNQKKAEVIYGSIKKK